MAAFDSVSKSLISTYPQDFLAFLLGHSKVQMLDMLNPEQTTVEMQVMDSLLRVQIKGQEALVHCEFQTTDSTALSMPLRMARYMGRCLAEHGLRLFSHVIYLRPDAGRHDPGQYIQEDVGYEVVLRYKVIRLTELDGLAHLASGNVGVLPFTPLMGRPEGMDVDAWLRRCVETTEGLAEPRSVKASVLAHMGVLSSLVCEESTIFSLISEEIMTEFPLFETLRKRAWEQGIERGREEGIEQGREQGIEQGIEQGGRERAVEDLLDVLAIRFGLAASDPLADRIGAIDDVQRLKQLFRAAIQVSSLEAFRGLLNADE